MIGVTLRNTSNNCIIDVPFFNFGVSSITRDKNALKNELYFFCKDSVVANTLANYLKDQDAVANVSDCVVKVYHCFVNEFY
ncbi:MAG: hypothetical protein HDQ88_04950 [Clostridia bacterium]|nr:hypothetical protein [Clostridia bacterium]